MNKRICLDSSVIIKTFVYEKYSDKALDLFNKAVDNNTTILLPDFAWAEIGSVLRKKVRLDIIKYEEAKELWKAFQNITLIKFVPNKVIINIAWDISFSENLPTLYDASYVAVAKVHSSKQELCTLWTADKKLINSLSNYKKYVKHINEF